MIENLENEVWKDVVGYEGLYKVSNMGRIKSIKRHRAKCDKILKPDLLKGYHRVTLCSNNKIKRMFVHRLVAIAFIQNTDNKPDIDHINYIKNDNRVDNIRWATRSENNQHTYDGNRRTAPWLGKTRGNHNWARRVNQYTKDGEFVKTWNCILDIKDVYGEISVSQCCNKNKRYKSAGGYLWKFTDIQI